MVQFSTKLPNFYNRSAAKIGGPTTGSPGATNISGGSNSYNTSGIAAPTRSRNINLGNNTDVNTYGQYAPSINIAAAVNTQGDFALGVGTSSGSIGVTYASTGYTNPNILNPVANRLNFAGLPFAGIYQNGISAASLPEDTLDQYAGFTDSSEDRVIISDQTGKFIGSMANFAPLVKTGGVLFPYNPIINITHKANYELDRLIHTNYSTPYYTSSSVDSIQIQGRFTANTPTRTTPV